MPSSSASLPWPAAAAWRLPRRGWLAAGLGSLLGVALQLQQPALWAAHFYVLCLWPAGLALAGLGLGWWRLPRGLGLQLGVGLLAVSVGFAAVGLRAGWRMAQGLSPELEGRDIVVVGLVEAMPQVLPQGLRFGFEVESAWLDGRPVDLPPTLWLSWYVSGAGQALAGSAVPSLPGASWPDLRAGGRWRLTVRLKQARGNRNPHGFDYELWMWEQGYRASGYVRSGPQDPPPQLLQATHRHPLEQWRQRVREAIWRGLSPAGGGAVPTPQAGVVVALVTGDQHAIGRADWDLFRTTGVAHLMSISGLHITCMAWLAGRVLAWAWRQTGRAAGVWGRCCLWLPAPWFGQLGGLAVALLYSAFCGWGVPAQRTVGMLAVVTALRLGGQRWPWSAVWLLMAVVVVAWDPWALLQAGFWLSFVAVAILLATDPGRRDAPADEDGGAGRLRRAWQASGVPALWREQFLMTVALAPLTLMLFGQMSLVGLLANLLAIPWVTGVVTPLALLGVLYAPLWGVSALAVEGLMWLLQGLAAWPLASWSVPAAPLWVGAVALAGGLLAVLRLPWAWRCLGLPLLLPLLCWQSPRPAPGRFEILAADIGQGNALIVRTAGHAMVYDAGPRYSEESDAGDRVLGPLLRALGERIDLLMLSHRDSDHTGGAASVLAHQPQARLWSSLEVGHTLLSGRVHTRCLDGLGWQWDGVRFEVLHPVAADYGAATRPNAVSCVLRIRDASGATALLVGDIEQAQEQALLARRADLAADFLLVPHHGSKTSSSEAFLRAVHPRLSFVQAGYRNRFNHPAPVVLARYRQLGLPVLASPSCGALWWRSAAPGVAECERERHPRYWQGR